MTKTEMKELWNWAVFSAMAAVFDLSDDLEKNNIITQQYAQLPARLRAKWSRSQFRLEVITSLEDATHPPR